MADSRKGPIRRLVEVAARSTGSTLVSDREYELMEAQIADRRMLMKEIDLMAYRALDYAGNDDQDIEPSERRALVKKARLAWQQDPQLGAAVDLNNDFVLGRGVPKPRARDEKVQEVLNEAWEDPDNKLVLTSYDAQLALNTDLSIQSNLFMLLFDKGDDGKVKLGVLDHDSVETVVRDVDNRRKILWYVAREKRIKWDFDNDKPVEVTEDYSDENVTRQGQYRTTDLKNRAVRYYAHWAHEAEGDQIPPKDKMGEGVVYHIAVNKTGEMAFGHPTMHRVLRWATAFNSLMESRVDIAKAAAALIMKRKVKGTPSQVRKMAEQSLSRRSELGRAVENPDSSTGELQGPRAGSVLTENEGVEHESFSLNSQAQNANVDGQMIRSQISASTHWPQHYLGDIGSANLANATAMELPVIKAVESRQELIEQLFRWFCDRAIERAIETGRLAKTLDDQEYAEKQVQEKVEGTTSADTDAPDAPQIDPDAAPVMEAVDGNPFGGSEDPANPYGSEAAKDLDTVAVEEENAVPEDRLRDLTYDFGLPSPQRRMLTDLVNSVTNIAKTFDPNGTNMELSRVLLAVVLGEGLELTDPAEVVDTVFPPGYQDPAMAMMQQQGASPPGVPGMTLLGPGQKAPGQADGSNEENPYGAPMKASDPNANPYGDAGLTEATITNGGYRTVAKPMPEAFDEHMAGVLAATDRVVRRRG